MARSVRDSSIPSEVFPFTEEDLRVAHRVILDLEDIPSGIALKVSKALKLKMLELRQLDLFGEVK